MSALDMNTPILMKHAERLGRILQIKPKEAWDLLNPGESFRLSKPVMDFFKFDHFLAIPDDVELSMNDVMKKRFSKEDYDYLVSLMFDDKPSRNFV